MARHNFNSRPVDRKLPSEAEQLARLAALVARYLVRA